MNEKSTINNEYDYSNIIPTEDYVLYLVKYCDGIYNQMIRLMNEDEEKNKQFKPEYKQYTYKKNYGTRFEIYIREKTYNNISCKDLVEFESAVKDGNLKNINSMEIKMDLEFRRGNGNNLEDHENSFTVKFEPYKIIFARKSNYIDQEINQVESAIKQILDKFPKVNSIFCTK